MARESPCLHQQILTLSGWVIFFGFLASWEPTVFIFGKPISGSLWFATFGLLGVGWLIDLFLIPGMDKAADIKYTTGRVDYNAAWILLTFLGFFGAHRFYMGKIGTGLLWFLTGGLLGAGAAL